MLSPFGQEILILREKDSAEEGRSIEQIRVLKPVRAILKGGHDVDPAKSQAVTDGTPDVVIEIKTKSHSEEAPELQFLDQGWLPQFAAQPLGEVGTPLQILLNLFSVVPVISQRGVDLTE